MRKPEDVSQWAWDDVCKVESSFTHPLLDFELERFARSLMAAHAKGQADREALREALNETLEEALPEELIKFWGYHEALCNIWADDNLTNKEQELAFRAYCRDVIKLRSAATATPEYVGVLIQSRVILALRHFMDTRALKTSRETT